MFNKSGIYKITNTVSGRSYIGSAVNLKKRWQGHIQELNKGRHTNGHLQKAWDKYGAGSFSLVVLEYCEPLSLIEREQYYMDMTFALTQGYNICPKAGSRLGTKMSLDAVRRLSERMKGNAPSDEARMKMSVASKGKPKTIEMRNRLSSARIGMKFSDEHKASLSAARRMRIISDETKDKTRIAMLGNKNNNGKKRSAEIKARLSENHFMSDETRKKLSVATTNRWIRHKQLKQMSINGGENVNYML